MKHSAVRFAALALVASGAAVSGSGSAGAANVGFLGFGRAGAPGHYGNVAAFNGRHRFAGRYARYGRYGNYPYGGFPPASLGYGDAPYYPASSDPGPSPVNENLSVFSRSVVIHRGPAFGEPGYYAHPVVYRLVPEPARRPGTRRFRVDKLQF